MSTVLSHIGRIKGPLVLVALLGIAGLAHADSGTELDFDTVMKSVEKGEILPLTEIRKKIADRLAGEIIDVEVHQERGQIIYEIKVLTSDGHVIEADVRAADGVILEIENE